MSTVDLGDVHFPTVEVYVALLSEHPDVADPEKDVACPFVPVKMGPMAEHDGLAYSNLEQVFFDATGPVAAFIMTDGVGRVLMAHPLNQPFVVAMHESVGFDPGTLIVPAHIAMATTPAPSHLIDEEPSSEDLQAPTT